MNRRLSSAQIEQMCVSLLSAHRRVGVRQVMRQLLVHHGASGSTERVAAILRRLQTQVPPSPVAAQSEAQSQGLQEQLRQALERAARAEEIERRHQDFWADQYARKWEELEQRYAASQREMAIKHAERCLLMSQRLAELEWRLAQYEGRSDGGGRPPTAPQPKPSKG